jgi:translation initiation factor IF-2
MPVAPAAAPPAHPAIEKPAAPALPAVAAHAPAAPAAEKPLAAAPGQPAPAPGTLPRAVPPRLPEKKIRDLNKLRQDRDHRPRPQLPPLRTPPGGRTGQPNIAAPPTPKVPSGGKDAKKPEEKTQKPLVRFDQKTMQDIAEGRVKHSEILQKKAPEQVEVPPPADLDDEEGKSKKSKKKGDRPGEVGDRKKRKEAREARAQERKAKVGVEIDHGKVRETFDDDDRAVALKPRPRIKPKAPPGPRPKHGKIVLETPITVRSLSEAIGIKSGELVFKLLAHGHRVTINSTLEPQTAEEIALEVGCEIEIKRPLDVEDLVLAEVRKADDPDKLVPRAPIVTIMGHVDHGKTSLLDRIRQSNVAATEAGGITQVLRAWRVEHGGRPITFLDTPGHEAFTKMRARGAGVTDIAVIVVAADDGVMPQTEEAINHAKAANVSLVVAINKVDLPNANLNRTRQQLYGLNVLPDNMGGDTPFVETSAATGAGIAELLDSISLVAELKELKANPNRPARGVCLEATLTEEEGVQATMLVQDGTLHKGDIILCGSAYGRIRQMYSDIGRSVDQAGPSVPVRITGLDAAPNASDEFVVLPELTKAREIAEKRKNRQQEAALTPRAPLDLTRLMERPLTELKVILKADFRGSIEAIRKELEKLKHEEVTVRVLHDGIGGITENDVQLALTSPEDTMIVGFNVVPDDRAKALAEERGISIREYNVIYMLTDDIRAALEGKLKPRQEVVHLGRAVVRETFKISRVGTIAGCYVTQGTLKRSAKIRLIREGTVIYPPPDKSAGLDSLKRFKDDAAEVREGFECGLKIAGYDDIKVGDVVEAYRIEEVQRTLD